MKVGARIALGSGLLFALLLAVLAYHVSLVRRLAGANEALSEVEFRVTMIALEQSLLLRQLDEFTRKFFVTRDSAYAERMVELRQRFSERLGELEALDLAPATRSKSEELAASWERFSRLGDAEPVGVAEPADAAGSAGVAPDAAPLPDPADAAARGRQDEELLLLDTMRRQTAAVLETTGLAVAEQVERSARASRRAERISWAVALGALLVSLPVLWLTVRSIHRPLQRLTAGTRTVAGGDYSIHLDPAGDDELARLAESFNQMVRRLRELDQIKKDFLSHLSHELKTPLVAMQETNELLIDEIPGPLNPKQKRLLDLNRESSVRLAAMLTELLDLARMEAETVRYALEPCDLTELAASQTAAFEARGRESGVALTLERPRAPVRVRCDRDRMAQVIGNLLDNAVKFSPRGGAVTVSLRPPAPDSPAARAEAVLEVRDRGPGIPRAERERIFEKFHQLAAGGRSRGGVGLGLAICREIVAAHGGLIGVADHDGGGSVFFVRLPAEVAAADPEPVESVGA